MDIPSLLLIALLGGPDPAAPEATAPVAPLQADDKLNGLSLLHARWMEEGDRAVHGVDLGRWSESAPLPIPPALFTGPRFHHQVNGEYLVDDLALDFAAGLVWNRSGIEAPDLLGMEVSLLTNLREGSFGLALWRAF